MDDSSQILARNLASVMGARKNEPVRPLKADRTLQVLVADLVAARTAVGMTQESGVHTHPTLRTIQKYAVAVGAPIEIRVGKGL